jgi:hypothetical protein
MAYFEGLVDDNRYGMIVEREAAAPKNGQETARGQCRGVALINRAASLSSIG